ncbi:MAG TPA: GNAT family N-acetyltransferase [Jiangellales bacterium]|nr:GNAT family N-acetyltransferase [Jiangellales bacterium]
MDLTVADVPDRQRYEARDGSAVAGFAAYQRAASLVVFTHTEVEPAYEGKGVGSTLVRGALDHVRDQGLDVLPLCPFVKAWIAKHPEYQDLVYRSPASTAKD